MNGDKKRQQDFLQGMVMKIRFIKRLTAAELDKKLNGSSALGSYDKVQVKLTQLELSNVRMVASSKFIGTVRCLSVVSVCQFISWLGRFSDPDHVEGNIFPPYESTYLGKIYFL